LNKFERITALAAKVHEEFEDAKSFEGKLSVFMDKKNEQLTEVIGNCTSNAAGLKADIATFKKQAEQLLICPSCDAQLRLDSDKLVSFDNPLPDDSFMEESAKKIEELDRTKSSAEFKLDFLRKTTAEVNELKKGLAKDPDPELKDRTIIQSEIAKLNKDNENNNKVKESYISYESAVDRYKAIYDNLKDRTGDAEDISDNKIAELEEEIRQANMKSKRFHIEVKSASEDVTNYSFYKVRKDGYDRCINQIKSLEGLVKTAEKSVNITEEKYAAAERLKEIADFAASSAVESKILEINNSSSFFIDKMFKDDGTIIQLSNFTTTQKGDEKAKIGIDVYHKGHKPKNIKPFSGGEKSRACLCFQLGLSELYNSPILMIDEGLTGVHSDLLEECLDILKEVSKDKLILVIEHGAPDSAFDEVISI